MFPHFDFNFDRSLVIFKFISLFTLIRAQCRVETHQLFCVMYLGYVYFDNEGDVLFMDTSMALENLLHAKTKLKIPLIDFFINFTKYASVISGQ